MKSLLRLIPIGLLAYSTLSSATVIPYTGPCVPMPTCAPNMVQYFHRKFPASGIQCAGVVPKGVVYCPSPTPVPPTGTGSASKASAAKAAIRSTTPTGSITLVKPCLQPAIAARIKTDKKFAATLSKGVDTLPTCLNGPNTPISQ